MKTWLRVVLGVVLGFLCFANISSRVYADAPFLDDDFTRRDSRNKKFFTDAGPRRKSTVVFRQEGHAPAVRIWEMPGWFRYNFISDDGEYLVTGCDEGDMLPLNYKRDEVVVSFYFRGKFVRAVHLDEIVLDPGNLTRTNSHFLWGIYEGFSGSRQFIVDTYEQRRLIFDVTTGAVVKTIVPSPSDLVKPLAPPSTPTIPAKGDRHKASRIRKSDSSPSP